MSKEVLEYTEEELRNLSTEELKRLLNEAESGEVLYNTKQMVSKLSLNSLYGALANKYFPLFNLDMAPAITGNGRYFIALLGQNINKTLSELYGYDVQFTIYGDTDSVYFSLDKFVQKEYPNHSIQETTDWLDSFIKQYVDPIIEDTVSKFSNKLNAFYPEAIGADREVIADKAVFTAKKKYFARVIDSEGVRYDEPYKIKVTGLEIAKSSTPDFVKKKLKENAIKLILDSNKDEIVKWVDEVKKEFIEQPLDSICKASSVSRVDYNLGKDIGVPINSRAAIVYNNYIKKNNLEDTFNLVEADDNIRMCHLLTPNPFHDDIIGFKDSAILEDHKQYIDYDTNFQKYFQAALELMVAPLGYDLNKTTEVLDEW